MFYDSELSITWKLEQKVMGYFHLWKTRSFLESYLYLIKINHIFVFFLAQNAQNAHLISHQLIYLSTQ